MHYIAARKGDFILFALLKRDNAPGITGPDMVVSAPWLEDNSYENLKNFMDLVAKSIGRKSLLKFPRFVIIPPDDPRLKFILETMPVEDGERRFWHMELFGLEMYEGVILHAKRPTPKKRARKALEPVGAGSSRGRR
jgi:hypothetical protein